MTNPITILLVDDHQIVRDGVRAYLDAQPDLQVAGEAASGEEAVRLAADLVPDVVLMDLVMPGMDGVEATWRVRRVSPRTQVVVLTSFHDDAHVFNAIKAGALSYLLKDVGPAELAEAVRAAARGEVTLNSRVAARLLAEMRAPAGPGRPPNPFAELSEREQDVLRLIAEGLSNAEIAGRLTISEKTVKGHVSNILGKLHLADRTQAAVFAWRQGLMRSE
jgi:NarL family two-component system response regulator LiaR